MTGSLRRLLQTTRDLDNARAALDMLAHRLRDGGPDMTREQIRARVEYAAEQINKVAPRSMFRRQDADDIAEKYRDAADAAVKD